MTTSCAERMTRHHYHYFQAAAAPINAGPFCAISARIACTAPELICVSHQL